MAVRRRRPQRVPVALVALDFEFAVEDGFEFELQTLVPRRGALRGEGIVRAAAERVNPVGAVAVALEAEQGGEQARAVAALDELVGGEVDARHEVLGVVVGEDDPVVAVAVGVAAELGPGLLASGGEDVFDGVDGVREVGAIDRGETQGRLVGRVEPEVGLHREVRRAHPEEVLGVRFRGRVGLGADAEHGAE